MHRGQRVDLARVSVEVTGVDKTGLPTEAVFRFSVPLEDPSLRWVRFVWKKEYVPFEVPGVGKSVFLDGL